MARGLNDGLLRLCNGAWRDDDGDAVDIVEVVRCKDCTKNRPLDRKNSFETLFAEECIWCMEHDYAMYEDDFCSYAERRKERQ